MMSFLDTISWCKNSFCLFRKSMLQIFHCFRSGLARRVRARLLFASTSEVYGDPQEHPQKENYCPFHWPIPRIWHALLQRRSIFLLPWEWSDQFSHPDVLKKPSFSLYNNSPNITGITKDILVATDATDTPRRCEVFAIRLKTTINRTPNNSVP